MKTKILYLLMTAGLLGMVAWGVHLNSQGMVAQAVPNATPASAVPEKYQDVVRKGLEYLAKNQHKDGHWEGDDGKHPVAMTGLVGLAMYMEGTANDPRRGEAFRNPDLKFTAHVDKAVDWLMAKSQPKRDGLIFSEHPSETARYMEGHGFATLLLAGAVEHEANDARRKKLTEILTGAVKYIVKAQSSQGGWYHTSKVEGHDFDAILPTVIQVQALQAADNAGIPVPRVVIGDALEYLKMAIVKHEVKPKPDQNRNRAADTAAALACRYKPWSRPQPFKDELAEKWFKYCQNEIPVGRNMKFGRDELTQYYYAQAVLKFGDDAWTGYRAVVFDHLKGSQNKDGSWPPSVGISVGPVYATSLWCTILQLANGRHPSNQSIPVVVD